MTRGARAMSAGMRRWIWCELARWCQAFKQSDTALKFFGYALAAAPDDPKTLASIGFELAQAGRKREALAYFDRVSRSRTTGPKSISTARSCCRN